MVMKRRIIATLTRFIAFLSKKDSVLELKKRTDIVGDIIYTTVPELYAHSKSKRIETHPIQEEGNQNLLVIEGGSFNYFQFNDGSLPKFAFVCPQIPLYVYIGGPASASLELALSLGVSKEHWSTESGNISAIEGIIPRLGSEGKFKEPKLLVFRWNDACTKETVLKRFQEVFNAA